MAVDVTNLTGGPAELQLSDTRIAHTQGGIPATVTPDNRLRTVDQYGNTGVDVIHQGDDVRVTPPLAEWTAAVLGNIYNPGNDSTSSSGTGSFTGIGRSAGFVYTTNDLKIIPLLSGDTDKKAQFFRATPVGEFTITHNVEDDRIMEVEFVCLADPNNQDDGQLIGKIFVD